MYSAPPCAPPEPVVSRFWIPGGALGIELTVWYMRRLVRASYRSPLLRETGAAIVGASSTDTEAAQRIRSWLEAYTVFEEDPVGIETIRSPDLMLGIIECGGIAAGDCDDVAVLGAALGLAVGLPARFVLLAFQDPGLYSHVFTELITAAGPVELDTTRPAQMPPDIVIRRRGTRGV